MEILDWLCQRDDGLGHLTDKERESIINFALLWMYFEARLVHTEANADTLMDLVDRLEKAVSLDVQSVSRCYDYFRKRYWNGGAPSDYFTGLRMTGKLAGEVLPRLENPANARGKLIACLLIILRYRNNLFHGNKWLYGLAGQQQNFVHATQLLMEVIALDDSASNSR